tara:strand:+ start:403 stop:744 length:342 start_codon:yes stop_codon:yes gene_type:complete
MRQKRADTAKRIEGELPEAPSRQESIPDWWSEAASVLDRIRKDTNDSVGNVEAQINASNIKALYESNADTNTFNDFYKHRLENLEEALGIEGQVLGTENEQEIDNKFIGGGSF